ncbi:unnamed protein product, partial [Prorocentrum cordatum]
MLEGWATSFDLLVVVVVADPVGASSAGWVFWAVVWAPSWVPRAWALGGRPSGAASAPCASASCTHVRDDKSIGTCCPGKYWSKLMLRCEHCAPGHFSTLSADQCESCPPGEYQDERGQSECKSCAGK